MAKIVDSSAPLKSFSVSNVFRQVSWYSEKGEIKHLSGSYHVPSKQNYSSRGIQEMNA
jgi:hypothetical protein